MTATPRTAFDPVKVAYYEKAGWQAYYDRQWLRVLGLMVGLNREQFRMSLPAAMSAALDIVRASIAFAPLDNDLPTATDHLRRYYAKARRAAGLQTPAETLARLEIAYWAVHRELAIQRQKQPDLENIAPMVDALTALHAALFGLPPEAARRSAELRALAAQTVDRITGRYSTDIPADWRQIEAYLQQAYREIAVRAA
jgi:hypothetical protein